MAKTSPTHFRGLRWGPKMGPCAVHPPKKTLKPSWVKGKDNQNGYGSLWCPSYWTPNVDLLEKRQKGGNRPQKLAKVLTHNHMSHMSPQEWMGYGYLLSQALKQHMFVWMVIFGNLLNNEQNKMTRKQGASDQHWDGALFAAPVLGPHTQRQRVWRHSHWPQRHQLSLDLLKMPWNNDKNNPSEGLLVRPKAKQISPKKTGKKQIYWILLGTGCMEQTGWKTWSFYLFSKRLLGFWKCGQLFEELPKSSTPKSTAKQKQLPLLAAAQFHWGIEGLPISWGHSQPKSKFRSRCFPFRDPLAALEHLTKKKPSRVAFALQGSATRLFGASCFTFPTSIVFITLYSKNGLPM